MLTNEYWKDIEGYERLYQVSNLGRVKSLEKWCGKNHFKERILKQKINNSGYYIVGLCKNGISKNKTVHRLVAQAFINNPNNLPCVNHINGNKFENNVNNLEYCTHSYNTKEAYRLGLKKPPYNNLGKHLSEEIKNKISKSQKGKINKGTKKRMKKVIQYSKDMKYINTYDSSYDAMRKTDIKANSIGACCRREKKSAGGYIWKYESEVVGNAL